MIRITIDTGNAAFDPLAGIELARILRQLADSIEPIGHGERIEHRLNDLNGNAVGTVKGKA